jgi:gas vesicle protein
MGKGTKFAVGTAVAAGIGYVAGILTAPKSGKDTRKDIHDTAVKAKTESEKKLKELNNDLTKLIATAKTKAKTAQSGAKSELHKALDVAVGAKEKAREVISAFHEGESEDKDLQKAVTDVNKAIDHLKKYLDKHAETEEKAK